MVSAGRPGIHPGRLCHGHGDGSRARFPLLWSCSPKVGPEHDMGLHGFDVCHQLPVVFLGLLSRIFTHRYKRIHRQLAELWSHEHSSYTEPWFSPAIRSSLCFLSGMVATVAPRLRQH